jgi:hypothetical protein
VPVQRRSLALQSYDGAVFVLTFMTLAHCLEG